MSVTTTTDEKIISLKEHVRCAILDLQEVLNPDTWGSDTYNDEYIETLEIIALRLIKIKRKL